MKFRVAGRQQKAGQIRIRTGAPSRPLSSQERWNKLGFLLRRKRCFCSSGEKEGGLQNEKGSRFITFRYREIVVGIRPILKYNLALLAFILSSGIESMPGFPFPCRKFWLALEFVERALNRSLLDFLPSRHTNKYRESIHPVGWKKNSAMKTMADRDYGKEGRSALFCGC